MTELSSYGPEFPARWTTQELAPEQEEIVRDGLDRLPDLVGVLDEMTEDLPANYSRTAFRLPIDVDYPDVPHAITQGAAFMVEALHAHGPDGINPGSIPMAVQRSDDSAPQQLASLDLPPQALSKLDAKTPVVYLSVTGAERVVGCFDPATSTHYKISI